MPPGEQGAECAEGTGRSLPAGEGVPVISVLFAVLTALANGPPRSAWPPASATD